MAAAGGIPNFPRQQAAPGPMVTFIRYFSPVLILIYFQWEPEPITDASVAWRRPALVKCEV